MQMEQNLDWPICDLSHTAFDELFENHFFVLGKQTYGEDNTLLWQWGNMKDAMQERNKAKNLVELRRVEKNSTASLWDLYFEQSFMLWYIGPYVQSHLGIPFTSSSETPSHFTKIPDRLWKKWPAKVTVDYAGGRVDNFQDWLGLLD